jgi:aerobic carbon-monoxide dehydrogenase small subunit
MTRHHLVLRVNGEEREALVESRRSLADCLREDLELTGTHVGCEHGVCGACTVLLDGRPVRSCLMLAVQAQGAAVTTVEGLAEGERLSPLQEAFHECFALQCGFCTPGFLVLATAFLRDHPAPGREQVRRALSSNLCRCTGYHNIVDAVVMAGGK